MNGKRVRVYSMISAADIFRNIEAPKYHDWSHLVISYLAWAVYLAGGDEASEREMVKRMDQYVCGLECGRGGGGGVRREAEDGVQARVQTIAPKHSPSITGGSLPPPIRRVSSSEAAATSESVQAAYNAVLPTVTRYFDNYSDDNAKDERHNAAIKDFLLVGHIGDNIEMIKYVTSEYCETIRETCMYRTATRSYATSHARVGCGGRLPLELECENFDQAEETVLRLESEETFDEERAGNISGWLYSARLFRNVAKSPYEVPKYDGEEWHHPPTTYLLWAIYLSGGDEASDRETVGRMERYVVGLEDVGGGGVREVDAGVTSTGQNP